MWAVVLMLWLLSHLTCEFRFFPDHIVISVDSENISCFSTRDVVKYCYSNYSQNYNDNIIAVHLHKLQFIL